MMICLYGVLLERLKMQIKAMRRSLRYLLYRHVHFDILYNDDRVIKFSVHTDLQYTVDITEDKDIEVEFMYSVK
jgi:hypothetical protein